MNETSIDETIIEDAGPQSLFSAKVEVPYDVQFAITALDWMAQVAQLAGGDRKERDGLRLALDETLNFLIDAYPDAEPWELVRVGFRLLSDGTVELSVANAGPPVHLDRIPTYDPDAVSETDMDGLWFFLAKKAVDHLEFQNLGMQGWRVIIRQELASPSCEMAGCNAPRETAKPAKNIAFTTRLATPDDAGDIMDLTFDTYRYSYPGEEFYHKSKLETALEDGSLVSTVVEDGGVIIGNSSMSLPADTPRCAYMSSLMVRRRYRRTRAIMHIIKETARQIDENFLDMEVYYATMVTAHPASQKVGAKVGFRPLALLLGVGAAVDYRNIDVADDARESFAIYARLTKEPTLDAIHIPTRHHEVMQPMLDQLDCPVPLADNDGATMDGPTTFSVSEDTCEGTAYMTLHTIGADWTERLRKELFRLRARRMAAAIVLVPAWVPQPEDIDSAMVRLNGIFTGLKPVSATQYYSVYSLPPGEMDFDHIKLADPLANALKDHVSQLYAEMTGA